ncbi:MAG: hypothetical protein ACLP0J_27410 [Solirubrobacteraceae bacterium]
MGNIAIPEVEVEATPYPEIDAAVEAVAARRADWQRLDVAGRIALLDRMIAATFSVAPRWVQAECERKRVAPDSSECGEEWGCGPWMALRNLRLLRATLRQIGRDGRPRLPGPLRSMNNGRACARILPGDAYDRALLAGWTGDVWMPEGVGVEEVQATIGGIYRAGARRHARRETRRF